MSQNVLSFPDGVPIEENCVLPEEILQKALKEAGAFDDVVVIGEYGHGSLFVSCSEGDVYYVIAVLERAKNLLLQMLDGPFTE